MNGVVGVKPHSFKKWNDPPSPEPEPPSIPDLVNDLINGYPISNVPTSIHPQLLMPLSLAKKEAFIACKFDKVNQIDSILKSLILSPYQIREPSQEIAWEPANSSENNTNGLPTLKSKIISKSIDSEIEEKFLQNELTRMTQLRDKKRQELILRQKNEINNLKMPKIRASTALKPSLDNLSNTKARSIKSRSFRTSIKRYPPQKYIIEGKYASARKHMEEKHQEELEEFDRNWSLKLLQYEAKSKVGIENQKHSATSQMSRTLDQNKKNKPIKRNKEKKPFSYSLPAPIA